MVHKHASDVEAELVTSVVLGPTVYTQAASGLVLGVRQSISRDGTIAEGSAAAV